MTMERPRDSSCSAPPAHVSACLETSFRQIDRAGFTVLPRVFTPAQVDTILRAWADALGAASEDATIRGQAGVVYAARNILELWPAAADVWRQPPLPKVLAAVLGLAFGLVRGLYFDKPPEQTWALPWHKDLTIAVRDNSRLSSHFHHPTRKAGVPHVEAPLDVLENMLTVRIHLDDMTEENGPLKVIPGSHKLGKAAGTGDVSPRTIRGDRGDVLLMRPLVEHSSGRSLPGTRQHRRVLHLEFAASPALPDGYEWYHFIPGSRLALTPALNLS